MGKSGGVEIRSDRVFRLPISRDEVWQRIIVVADYQTWWPWLRGFDGTALLPGAVWRFTLRAPPLRYAIHGDVCLHTVIEPWLIGAELTGDLTGQAQIALRSLPKGTEARLLSRLVASRQPLSAVARAVPSLARRAHDHVLNTAARQFTTASGAGVAPATTGLPA